MSAIIFCCVSVFFIVGLVYANIKLSNLYAVIEEKNIQINEQGSQIKVLQDTYNELLDNYDESLIREYQNWTRQEQKLETILNQ